MNFSSTYRNFIHQGLDLVDNLVSVGLVDVGAEGDLALLRVLRYGRHTEHLGRGLKTLENFFSSVWTKIVFPDPGLDASLRAECDAVKIAARSEA